MCSPNTSATRWRRTICKQYVDEADRLWCLTLDPALEELVTGHLERSERGTTNTMPPATTAQQIVKRIGERVGELTQTGRSAVILCGPQVRSAIRRMIEGPAAGGGAGLQRSTNGTDRGSGRVGGFEWVIFSFSRRATPGASLVWKGLGGHGLPAKRVRVGKDLWI